MAAVAPTSRSRRPDRRASNLITAFTDSRWLGPVAFVLAIGFPFAYSSNYALSVTTSAAVFVMLAVGLNIVVGYCGLLDLGYAAFFAVGAYVSGILATQHGFSMVETIPFVILATIVAGLIIGTPTLRLRSDYLAIVTLGFGEIIRVTANNLDITGGPSGIYGIPSFELFGYSLTDQRRLYYFTVCVAALAVAGASRLGRSKLGRAWRFIREDEDAAEAMGINTYTTKIAAYVVGAVWGGLAGTLFASQLSAVSPASFTFLYSALVLMAVVLGGMGSMPGAVLGAIFISLAPEVLRDLSKYQYFAFGIFLIVVMLFRQQGLWPARAVERDARRDVPDVEPTLADGDGLR
ncbi:MAG: branched-chain amino acid ABC transporter permease [Mycobacteriales bacterium]